MMRNRTENNNPEPRPNCTIEEARQLLAEIRSGYQSLSIHRRVLIQQSISAAAARAQIFIGRDEEPQCFESAL
jgi:hypothetical protein